MIDKTLTVRISGDPTALARSLGFRFQYSKTWYGWHVMITNDQEWGMAGEDVRAFTLKGARRKARRIAASP